MRTVPFPFVGGAYADESRPWSMQDTVNYLPTLAERSGTRSQAMLKTPPGLRPYTRGSTGIVRGTYNAEGKFFAVIGTTFYQVMPGGLLVSKGVVPGLGRVAFTHNQISLGNEVVVVNGSAGYVYNTVTNTFGRITDPGYPGSAVAGFIDGYVIGIEPQGRYAFNSRPAAATDYNTLDRFTSEVSPDRLVTQGISNNELLLLSTTSGEFFQNTGASQQPFRSKRITIDKGCAGPYTLVDLDNSLCWLGGDGVFYRLENYTPKRISTRPIEQAIRGLDWWQAFGFVWEDSGYACAYWTFPDGRTWGWDASNGEWHRRESYQMDRWRANTMTRWNDDWYAGDFQDGMIWRVDWDYIMEGCEEFVSERTCAVMSDNQNRVRANRLELVMDTGMVETQHHGPPTVSGDLPNGVVGDSVDFTYTVTTDYPGQPYTLIATGLPPGLTMDGQGHVTGVFEDAGTFDVSITVVDDCGGESTGDDQIVVIEYPFDFLASALPAASNRIYIGTDADTWTLTSTIGTGGSFVRAHRGRVLVFAPGLKVSDDLLASFQAISVPFVSIADAPVITTSGRIYVKGGDGDLHYSDDTGSTWMTSDIGIDAVHIAGDDHCLVAATATHYAVSLTGPDGFGTPIAAPGGAITSVSYGADDENGMFIFGGAGLSTSARWTEDNCQTFTVVTIPSPGGDPMEAQKYFRTSTGAWLACNRENSNVTDTLIARSANGKTAFAYVTNPSANMNGGTYDCFAEQDGVVVAAVRTSGGTLQLMKSTTDGVSWELISHGYSGFTVTTAYSITSARGLQG